MLKQILKALFVFVLILFPLFGGNLLGSFSPYVEGNSMGTFVILLSLLTLTIGLALFVIIRRFGPPLDSTVSGGVILFFIGCVMLGISGLAAAPDLSIKMLEHPEREHFRYILLFIGAFLSAFFFMLCLRDNSFALSYTFKWIIAAGVALAFTEMFWEFSHHYLYPEGLKKWTEAGKKAEDFVASYDNFTVVLIGAAGRLIQFSLIIWLSLRLYQLRKVKIWSPVLSCLLCLMGILSSIIIVVTEMHFPKGLEFLFLFFIPGIPLLLFYWIGVALLTQKPGFVTTQTPAGKI